jgi:YidC/Oxa1 family membrane protein insertase
MFASIPIISPAFQLLLNTIGWVLAEIYRFIPNYGAAIVILTLFLRFILVPLGVKQIKSMQNMQALQPKLKELQKKYKGNKPKLQEEQMKLYKDAGVNPLGGCLPLLLQFPILIAMYAVIRMPMLVAVPTDSKTPTAYVVNNNHLPVDSTLFKNVITHENTGLFIVDLQCSAAQSGNPNVVLDDTSRNPVVSGAALYNGRHLVDNKPTPDALIPGIKSDSNLDCGTGTAAKIPYFVLLLFMIATTFYQQRQMQKASPPGSASGQQQAIMRIMPIMFGVFGFAFPAGLVLYWSVANLFQIGQQSLLLKAGHIGPEALERQMAAQKAKNAANQDSPPKKGFMARMMEQAQDQKKTQQPGQRPPARKKPLPPGASGQKNPNQKNSNPKKGTSGNSSKSGSSGGSSAKSDDDAPPRPPGPRRKPNTGPKKRPGGSSSGSRG